MIADGRLPQTPPADVSARPPVPETTGSRALMRADIAPVESELLFRGQRTVEISHKGEIYRLQATRLGKLILTK